MKISILTLFPEMFAPLQASILARAQAQQLLDIDVIDFRAFSTNKHRCADDYPYGGGAGMVLAAQPVCDAMASLAPPPDVRIYLSPRGVPFAQSIAQSLSKHAHIALLCGHYEGVDQRALDLAIDMELSIGDYVLTGGELAAMVVTDAVARLLPGVLGSSESAEEESHTHGRLEYPHYTRPVEFHGLRVPDVLLSGHHANIRRWRLLQSLLITRKNRPDLWAALEFTEEERKAIRYAFLHPDWKEKCNTNAE